MAFDTQWRPRGGACRPAACAACAAMAMALVGCGSAPVPPMPAATAPPARYQAPTHPSASPAMPADGAWWRVFDDPRLDALQAQARTDNPQHAQAAARVAQAQAAARSAHAHTQPQWTLGSGASRQAGLLVNDAGTDGTLWRATLSAQHTVDLGGRLALGEQAAVLDLQQRQALQRQRQLQVQAAVAEAWFRLLGLRHQQQLLQAQAAAWQHSAALVAGRWRAGLASSAEAAAARAEAAKADAQLQALSLSLAHQQHALTELLGGPLPTAAAPPPAGAAGPATAEPDGPALPQIPAGLPSQMLARRADVAAAERAVQAARHRLGAAQAAGWPSLRLTASGGLASAELGDLLRGAARSWSLAGLLALPLFDGGRRDAQQAAAQAELALAAAQWRGQMLQALREVDDQLASLHSLAAQAAALCQAEAESAHGLALQQGRLARGLASPLAVLEAQRRLLDDRLALARVQQARRLALVGLVRALGGGWSAADGADAPLADAPPAPVALAAAPAHRSR